MKQTLLSSIRRAYKPSFSQYIGGKKIIFLWFYFISRKLMPFDVQSTVRVEFYSVSKTSHLFHIKYYFLWSMWRQITWLLVWFNGFSKMYIHQIHAPTRIYFKSNFPKTLINKQNLYYTQCQIFSYSVYIYAYIINRPIKQLSIDYSPI